MTISGTVRRVGPIETNIGNHTAQWTGPSSSVGREFLIAGTLREPESGRALLELVNNADRRVYVAGMGGVLEWLDAYDDYADLQGWCLLTEFTYSDGATNPDSDVGWGPFSLSGIALANRRLVVVRSARARGNAFGLSARSRIVQPFWGEAAGQEFELPPGGTSLVREYDPRTDFEPGSLATDGRNLRLHTGVINGADPIAALAVPVLRQEGEPPTWVSQRGQDVMAWDRTSGRRVLGPMHPFARTTDLMLDNGLFRFWCGNRGMQAFLNCEAFTGGEWRAIGSVLLSESDDNVLDRVRLSRVTPDKATAVLELRDMGQVHVSLLRGERGVRVQHGDALGPSVSAARSVRWIGGPPPQNFQSVSRPTGVFGTGIYVPSASRARYQWPDDVSASEWSVFLDVIAPADYIAPVEGYESDEFVDPSVRLAIFAIESPDGGLQRAYYDGSTQRVVFELGSQTLESPHLGSIAQGQVLGVVASFSVASGMSLTVRTSGAPADREIAFDDDYSDTYSDTYSAGDVLTISFSEDAFFSQDTAATDPGTASEAHGVLAVGPHDGAPGDGAVYDQAMVFHDVVSQAEAAALTAQASRLGSMPEPLGRAVWVNHFDTTFEPALSSYSNGRALGSADDWGLSRMVCTLVAVTPFGLGSLLTTSMLEAGAYALSSTEYSGQQVHEEFVVEHRQEARLR